MMIGTSLDYDAGSQTLQLNFPNMSSAFAMVIIFHDFECGDTCLLQAQDRRILQPVQYMGMALLKHDHL